MQMLAALVFEASDLWPAVLAGLAVVTAVVIWVYPPQVRGNGVLGWVALGLRWMGLAALAIALLRPVLLEPNASLENGAVMVLVDCSQSMGVIDRGRTPAQWVALAAALGKLPEGVRSAQVAGAAENIRSAQAAVRGVLGAQSDLDYARISGRGINEKQSSLEAAASRYAEAAAQLTASAQSLPPGTDLRARLMSMGPPPRADARDVWSKLPTELGQLSEMAQSFQSTSDQQLYASDPQVRSACDALAKRSRLSLVQEAMLDPRNGLNGKLMPKGTVMPYSIGAGLEPIALADDVTVQGQWQARSPHSDLTGAVGAALDLAARQPVKAIVLFSDGRQVGGRSDLTSGVRPSGVPVFTVDVAAPKVPDAWISAVTTSSTGAFAGESIEGQVEVRCRGLSRLPDKVTISGSQARQEVALTPRPGRSQGGDTELTARYTMPVGPTGLNPVDKLEFAIAAAEDEVTDQNNHVERWVKVSSEQLRVLQCAGAPSWDFQYVRKSLSERPWVRLETMVLEGGASRLALTPAQIMGHDVVILEDVPVAALDVNQWDAISRLASERGGSVILVAGAGNAIDDYGRQPIAGGLLPFHDLRPMWKQWSGEHGALRFVPTPLGESEMLTAGQGSESLRRWQELPGLFRYLQVPEKNLFAGVRELLVESDSGLPVLTERRAGEGWVYFLGLDETWRWRRPGTTREPGRFWEQLVRRAAGEPYAVVNGGLALDVNRVACEPGEVVNVRARVRGAGVDAAAGSYSLQILRAGKTFETVTLHAAGRGRYSGQIRDLAEGDYQLEMRGSGRLARSVARLPLHVAASTEAEMRDVSGDPLQLLRIARSTGGDRLTLDGIDRLPDRLGRLRAGESQLVRRPLYSSPLLFVFVLSCLAGEWALRKRQGLA